MSLHVAESESGSGLLVAEQSADERAVARMLRAHNPSLRLVPQASEGRGGVLWCVYRWNGPDTPASLVCVWQTPQGDPLPLSSRLLEKVQLLDRGTVGTVETPEEMNAKHQAALRDERIAEKEAIVADHRPYVKNGRLSVSVTDAKNNKPGWQRTRRPSVSD